MRLSSHKKYIVINVANFVALALFLSVAFTFCYVPIRGKFYTNANDIGEWLKYGLSFFGPIALSSIVPSILDKTRLNVYLKETAPHVLFRNKLFFSYLVIITLIYLYILIRISSPAFNLPDDATTHMVKFLSEIDFIKYILIATNAYYCSILGIREILDLQ